MDVRRPYTADSLLSFTITRADINVDPLPYFGVDSTGIGYLRLTTFNESSARRVREALLSMLADKELKGIVIDLRSNGGGLLRVLLQIASNFHAQRHRNSAHPRPRPALTSASIKL